MNQPFRQHSKYAFSFPTAMPTRSTNCPCAASECYRVYRVQISHTSLISTFRRCSYAFLIQLLKKLSFRSKRNEMWQSYPAQVT